MTHPSKRGYFPAAFGNACSGGAHGSSSSTSFACRRGAIGAATAARGALLGSGWRPSQQQSGHWSYDYYQDRLELIDNKVAALGGTLIATGHSMGGGMGIAGSYATGVPAILFNPAYVHPNYTVGQPGSIQVNVTRGDPLDFFRRSFGAPAQGELHHYLPLPSQGMKHSIPHFHSNP